MNFFRLSNVAKEFLDAKKFPRLDALLFAKNDRHIRLKYPKELRCFSGNSFMDFLPFLSISPRIPIHVQEVV